MIIAAYPYRTGFPFLVKSLAEDGEPFEEWDGTTVFTVLDLEDAPRFKMPSKSSASQITVYGPGSYFCIKLTRDQLAELYWRCKELTLAWEGLPMATGESASASASGGNYTTEEGEYVWVPASPREASLTGGLANASPSSGGHISRGAASDTQPFTEKYLLRSVGQRNYNSEGIEAPGEILFVSWSSVDSDADPSDANAIPRATANISTGAYWDFTGIDSLAESVIKVGENEFWWNPFENSAIALNGSGKWVGDDEEAEWSSAIYVPRNANATHHARATGRQRIQSGPAPGTSVVLGSKEITMAVNPSEILEEAGSNSIGAFWPIKLELAGGVLEGTGFGVLSTREGPIGDDPVQPPGAPVPDVSVGSPSIATIVFRITKWWTWPEAGSPTYNEDTGEAT